MSRIAQSFPNNISYKDSLVFIGLLGAASTLWQYFFGAGFQMQQLLIIKKMQDPGFLENDFQMQAIGQTDFVLFFFKLTAFMNQLMPIWVVFPDFDIAYWNIAILGYFYFCKGSF